MVPPLEAAQAMREAWDVHISRDDSETTTPDAAP